MRPQVGTVRIFAQQGICERFYVNSEEGPRHVNNYATKGACWMKTLNYGNSCTIVRLIDSTLAGQPLGEQLRPILENTPNIVLDVEGIEFTSMLIGELANLAREFNALWVDQPHVMAMTNLKPSSRQVMETVKFDRVIPIAHSYDEALKRVFNGAHQAHSAAN